MALGSETRWEIYSLIRSKPSHIEGLAERVRKHKSTVSRHVEVLEKAGLVKTLAVEGSRGARKNVYPTATRLLIDLS